MKQKDYEGVYSPSGFDIVKEDIYYCVQPRSQFRTEEKNSINDVVLDFRSQNTKFYIPAYSGIFHFVTEILFSLILIYKKDPKCEFYIDVRTAYKEYQTEGSFIKSMLDLFSSNGFNIIIIKPIDDLNTPFDILLNNTYSFNTRDAAFKYPNIKIFNDFIDNLITRDFNVKPYRNVYLSRKKVPLKIDDGNILIYDKRCNDEKLIEDFFISKGYEIVYPEDFNNYHDQIKFFYEVKTLVSITGAGLANEIYMKNGQKIIELVTPLHAGQNYSTQHNYYKELAFLKKHVFIGFHNDKDTNEIIEILNRNERFFND